VEKKRLARSIGDHGEFALRRSDGLDRSIGGPRDAGEESSRGLPRWVGKSQRCGDTVDVETTKEATPAPTLASCYAKYREEVYFTCLRYSGGRRAWAEDLTHDVFIKLLERLPSFTAQDNIGGWLYRVSANLCLSRLRREQSFLRCLVRGSFTPPGPDPRTTVEQRDEAMEAMATLGTLPAAERVALCLKVFDGLAQRDIAATLGFSEGYVSKLLSRALAKIRAAGWEVHHEPT
jgi:RNA polymerase sigma factor (sigma-70 family)